MPVWLDLIRRLLRAGLILGAFTLLAVTLWTMLWTPRPADEVARGDAIICLGAGMEEDGTLDPAAELRVARCVDLFKAGVAPVVLFSGGLNNPDLPSAGEKMARLAWSLGLPKGAEVIEGRAQSTLQNALFSLPLLERRNHLILVTESFHMPRSLASFKWAGAGELTPVVTPPTSDQLGNAHRWQMIPREAAAIWFNLARAVTYDLAGVFGMDDQRRVALLH